VSNLEVLLVEDDEEDYLLTKDVFAQIDGERHALHWVSDARAALRAIEEREFDVCLVDYRLGPDDGIELVRELIAAGHDLPVIVMTGQGDRDVDVEAAKAGAADYLIKGEVSPALLERTIRYAMRSRANLRALRESEAELRQTQRMDAVGQLAGGVAHDFNNMMTAVIGFSELVLARLDDVHPLRHHIEEIKRAGVRASAMTHQLLAFSRRQVLQTKVLDLNTVVVDVEKLLERLIAKNVEIVSVLDPALDPVEADPGQLEQVIMNLALNARDAMPAGGTLTIETGNIEIAAGKRVPRRPRARPLRAPRSQRHRRPAWIRRRWRRSSSPSSRPRKKEKEPAWDSRRSSASSSRPAARSASKANPPAERASRSTCRRRRRPSTAANRFSRSQSRHEVRKRSCSSRTKTSCAASKRVVLEECGYTVLEAESASKALELAADHHATIDLLLTDVVMPGLSGHELAQRLSAQRPKMKILYASGYAPDTIAQQGVLEPGVAFIPKPLTPDSLAHKVREVLDASLATLSQPRPFAGSYAD